MANLRLVSAMLLIAIRCFGQCNPHPLHPDGREPCPTIADQLSKAFDAARDFNNKVAQLNTTIAAARRRYWAAFPNGPDLNAAEKEFMNALWTKDMYYMLFAIQQGMTGDGPKMANAIAAMGGDTSVQSINKFPTNVDGGIRPYAFPLFANWVTALRRSEGREKDGTFASPTLLATAVQDKSNWRKAYENARNWAEFTSSGLDTSKYVTTQVYMVNQMEADVALVLARAKTSDMPDATAATRDLYNLFVKIFGEKEVAAAAQGVLRAPKNSVGGLTPRAEVEIGTYGGSSPNPFFLFLSLATATPRNYAIALMMNPYGLLAGQAAATFNTADEWNKAFTAYTQLTAKFGEPTVLAAAGRLKNVAKDDRGGPRGDPGSKGALFWFTELLKDPKTPLPDVSHFLASSYDSRWIGKTVEVRGTVSRVDVQSGHPPYATIHFKESKNDRFTAFTPNSEILDSYGQSSSGLVGKPIEIWGQVQDWRDGAGVRFLISSQLKVLDAGALANFRESAPDWMKLPLPASNLVDSPKYLAWKKFPAGSKANYELDLLHEYKPGTNQYTRNKISSMTFTLTSIDDERAVVKAESTVSHMRGGDTYSSNDQIFKAKQPAPGPPVDDPSFVKTTGEETLVINGRKIATRWESVTRASDPMTFTKTWTSDEVPGGLVRIQQQSHAKIVGEEYRGISQTLYAPIAGVEPQLGDGTPPASPPPGNAPPPAAPSSGTPPVSPPRPGAGKGVAATPPQPPPVAPPPPRGRAVPPAPASDGQAEFMQHYIKVMTRIAQDRVALAQAERKLTAANMPLPDDIRAAWDRLTSQQQVVVLTLRTRDFAAGEQNLRALEETLEVIEKFIGK
jgi:hypothetical protein